MKWGARLVWLHISIFILLIPLSNGLNSFDNVSPAMGDFIDEYMSHLDSGKKFFNPPKEMVVGITEIIPLSLTKENISSGEDIKLGDYMKAQLKGSSFDIRPLTDEEQLQPNKGFTTWKWSVTPLKSGNQTLVLVISVRVKIPGNGEENWNIVNEEYIQVRINPGYSASKFLEANWQYIFGGIGALIVLLATLFREKILEIVLGK